MTPETFAALHRPGDPFVLPNAWDVGSARALVAEGFPAIGTTSLGIAASHGLPDATGAARDALVATAGELLAAGLAVPVTVDLEDGLDADPGAVADLVAGLGPAGVNLEDAHAGALVDAAVHAAKVAAVKQRAPNVFVNARTDVFWLGDRSLDGAAAVGDKVSAETAVELGLADNDAPTIGEFILGLDGVESQVVGEGDDRRREPVSQARFGQLPLTGQLMHTVASPPVAYLLFAIGLGLIVFELFTAGVGIAGMVGAGSLVLGCYGLASLPTNPVGVALLLLATFGYAVDVQTGVPRAWSVIATVAFAVGSLVLYDGVSLSWIPLLAGIVGMALAMVGGMPAMVRTRFSTPTIGREWMIGEVGTAVGAVDPDGVVMVRDAPWRARTNRATPIDAGAPVRVASIEGLLLEVEPLEGAARDHRDRGGAD